MKNKLNVITVVLISVTVLFITSLFFIIPDKEISEKENRTLRQYPKFSIKTLISGDYTTDLAEYISDQFSFRDEFVSIKAYTELLLGKRENNGVIYAENDTLVTRDDITENRLYENLKIINEFENNADIPVCVAAIPRSVDVFSEYLPSEYPTEKDVEFWNDFYDTAKTLNITAPNLYDSLCSENNYYRTDHHYTTYGAYQVYALLGDFLDYKPKALETFTPEIVSDNFCGTSMRTSGFYFAKKDTVTLLRYNGDEDYNVIADGKKINLYDKSKINGVDKYAVFFGGNHARVDVTFGENREKLLVIRDSFADSIAPFLAMHYDLIMLDLRYFDGNIGDILSQEKPNGVLILESVSEIAKAKNISYLRRIQ